MNKTIPTKSRFFRRALALLAFVALPSQAAVVLVNPDFSSGSIQLVDDSISGTNETGNQIYPGGDALDGGWFQRNNTPRYSIVDGQARRELGNATDFLGMGQWVSDGKNTTGTGYTLSFDWATVIGAPVSGQEYTIHYDLVATDDTSTSSNAYQIRLDNDTLGTSLVSLATGSFTTGANTSGTFTTATPINFGTGYNNVGIRLVGFATTAGNDTSNYIAFDNVSVIPEPGTLVLLGISGLALGLMSIRRRRR